MNKINNVNLWFARNNAGHIVTINKSKNKEEYVCPICGSKVIPKAKESDKIAPHFSHINKGKCDSETMVHFWVKNELIKIYEYIKLSNGDAYMVKNISIENEVQTKFGAYKPDITINTSDNIIIYIEINHTNKKSVDKYIPMWRELGNIVVEVKTKDILNSLYNKDEYIYDIIYDFKNDSNSYIVAKRNFKTKINRKTVSENTLLDIDWFLKEIENYNKYEFDCTYIAVNEVMKIYKSEVIELLNNSSCSDIKKDYIDYKVKRISSIIKESIECDIRCENESIVVKTDRYVITPCSIWNDEGYVVDCIKASASKKEKEILELNLRLQDKIKVCSVSDKIYEDMNRRYSAIGIECNYSKSDNKNYLSKIVFPDKDIFIFFKNDCIDICETYEFTTRKYVYNPRRHMSTPRWIKDTAFRNIGSFDLNCNHRDVSNFICSLIRNIKYNIWEA